MSGMGRNGRRAAKRAACAWLLALAGGPTCASAGGSEKALRVRASEAVAPCVAAAGRAYAAATGRLVSVETGSLRDPGPAEVLVSANPVEMTRALEGGAAVEGSEVDVARIPWVLAVSPGNPLRLHGLADLGRPGLEVWILGGPAAYEARRALAAHPPERLQEATEAAALRSAAVALVPLSLAGGAERVAVDVPPLVAQAAVATRSARPEASRAFVRFLGEGAGQRAFAACAPSVP